MRIIITFLILIGMALVANMGAYVMSEDYRFFVKKLKYAESELIYEEDVIVDDTPRLEIIETIDESGEVSVEIQELDEDLFFLDIFSQDDSSDSRREDKIPELLRDERFILELFEGKFILTEQEFDENALLYDLIDEYPDAYREYSNAHLSLYVFSSKSYQEVKNILELVSYETSFEINSVDNFAQSSLYINLPEGLWDEYVRIAFEYENLAFGLKIKKDSYNVAKQLLEQL